MTRGIARNAAVALVLVGTLLALLPAGAAANKVSNPGSFSAEVTGGVFRIKTAAFNLADLNPRGVLNGTIASNGAVNIPQSGVVFPPAVYTSGSDTITVRIQAIAPWTGTLNPLNGTMSLRAQFRLKLEGSPSGVNLGGSCYITPIDVNVLTTGTTNPPGPNTSISGTPYASSSGTTSIVNNSFSVPEANGCGPFDIADGSINSQLGLPSSGGNNEVRLNLDFTPNPQPAISPTFTATPSSGSFPLNVSFNATGSTASAGILNYRWDFDGNGTFDQTTTGPTTSHTYLTPGTYQAKLRVTDASADADFAETTRTITVTPPPPDLSINKSHTGNFQVGSNGIYTLAVSNLSQGATVGVVTVTDSLPSGLSYVSASGTGWACGAVAQDVTCTRASVGASSAAPAISLTVGVASAALPSVTNTASVSTTGDSNGANNSDGDPTTVDHVDLTINKSHVGTFRPGSGNSYDVNVSNVGTAASTQTISVTDTLPSGLTPVSASGTGWNCNIAGQNVTCNRTTSIAAGGAAPTLTIEVDAGLPPSGNSYTATNTATVSTSNDPVPGNNADDDETLVIDAPDAAIEKSHAGNFRAGAQESYTLAVRNAGPQATTGTTTVTDTLPAGLDFVSAAGSGWICSVTGQDVTCDHAASIPADTNADPITLTVNVQEAAIPSVTNSATVATPDDPNSANDSDSDPTIVRAIDLAITKSHNAPFRVGRDGTWVIAIANEGESETAGTITVTDTIPAGLNPVSASGTGWNCGINGQDITCTRANALLGGESAPSISIVVGVTAAAAPQVSNTASVDTVDDFRAENDSSTDVTPIVEQDAAIAMSRSGAPTVGKTWTYTVSVDNDGTTATSGDVTVTDTLPAGLTFVSAEGEGWTCPAPSGQVVTCTRGPMGAESQAPDLRIRASVGPNAAPSVTNMATVATDGDRNDANDSASVATGVTAPDLTVSSSHSGPFRAGALGAYTLTVSNPGTVDTAGVTTVTDTLPTGLTYVDAAGDGWECSAAGQVVTCDSSGEIAAGQSAPAITLTAAVDAAAVPSVTNEVAVSTPGDSDSSNNSDSDPTNVTEIDLELMLDRSTAPAVGSEMSYFVSIKNIGTAATVGSIQVEDILPAGLEPSSASGPGWSCATSGQIVSCQTDATVGPGDDTPTLTITVLVESSVAEPVSNTATAETRDDTDTSNNSDTDEAQTVSRDPNLALSMLAQPSEGGVFRVGSDGTYRLTAQNVGGSPTSGPTQILTELPQGFEFKGATGTGWTCTAAAEQVTCDRQDPIDAGERSDVDIEVGVLQAAPETVTAEATASTAGDQEAPNDDASATADVTRVDLTVTSLGGSGAQSGGQTSFTIIVDNNGSAATIAPTVVTQELPPGFTFDSASGTGWTCGASGSQIGCFREDAIPPRSRTDSIAVTVNIDDRAVPSATTEFKVQTKDDVNGANDTSSRTVEVAAAPVPPTVRAAAVAVSDVVKVTRAGVAFIKVRCPARSDVPCAGNLVAKSRSALRPRPGARRRQIRFAAKDFRVAAGQSFPVRIELSEAHQDLLERMRRISVVATLRTERAGETEKGMKLQAPIVRQFEPEDR